jgi:CheY-like chemotaxis protein/HPt (histidine-containing phosphotransfer) domain-containing protein
VQFGSKDEIDLSNRLGFLMHVPKPIDRSILYNSLLKALALMGEIPEEVEEKNRLGGFSQKETAEIKILLAEDNFINRKLAISILNRAGFAVDAVENGRLAVEGGRNKHYDVILMDVQMPDMDGFEATREIRKLPGAKSKIPIIAMTAHAMKEDRDRCLEAGMNDYIPKPVKASELIAVIEKWVKNDSLALSHPPDVVLNMKTALERFADDRVFLCELLGEFLAKKEANLGEFARLLAAKDGGGIKHLTHGLKGSAANLSCEILYHLFSEIEEGLREENWSDVARVIERLPAEYSRVADFMKTIQ